MAEKTGAKNGFQVADITMPTVRVVEVASERASAFLEYPVASMASRTRSVSSGLTGRVRFSTCDTVEMETPALAATPAMVTKEHSLQAHRATRVPAGGPALTRPHGAPAAQHPDCTTIPTAHSLAQALADDYSHAPSGRTQDGNR